MTAAGQHQRGKLVKRIKSFNIFLSFNFSVGMNTVRKNSKNMHLVIQQLTDNVGSLDGGQDRIFLLMEKIFNKVN